MSAAAPPLAIDTHRPVRTDLVGGGSPAQPIQNSLPSGSCMIT